MKITDKHLQILSGLACLLATIIFLLTKSYNKTHIADPILYGKWISYFLFIVGLFLLMPWRKKKDK